MILYNMRYRGPYEYDKFVLNTMQYMNEAKRLGGELGDTTITDLKKQRDELMEIIEEETGERSTCHDLLALRIQQSL